MNVRNTEKEESVKFHGRLDIGIKEVRKMWNPSFLKIFNLDYENSRVINKNKRIN